MFTNFTSKVVGFASISKTERENADSETQTAARDSKDQNSQVCFTSNSEVQTETAPGQPRNVDLNSLGAFLSRVETLVLDELNFATDFSDLEEVNETDEYIAVKSDSYPSNGTGKKVAGVSWNCSGGTLAIGYSELQHDSWCNHESAVVVQTRALYRPVAPRSFATRSCVSCVCFHPWDPSILGVGLFSGEVLVLDLRKEDDWHIKETEIEHTSQAVHVGWWEGSSGLLCISAGADGRILLRKVGLTSRTISVVERYLITRRTIDSKFGEEDSGLEITSLSHLRHDEFIAGVGRGGVVHTSLNRQQSVPTQPGYFDPCTFSYQPHNAVVTAVRASANGSTFCTGSSDGEVRVYTALEAEPKFLFISEECVLDVFWSSSSVLGVCGTEKGVTYVRTRTGQMIDIHGPTANYVATKASFNVSRNVLAVGRADGIVDVWRITPQDSSEF